MVTGARRLARNDSYDVSESHQISRSNLGREESRGVGRLLDYELESYLGMTLERGRPKYVADYTPVNFIINHEEVVMQAGYSPLHRTSHMQFFCIFEFTIRCDLLCILQNTALLLRLDSYVPQRACF
jgi:hypothetical protein